MKTSTRQPRTGFTLVEMLVVAVIITILLSLISVAVFAGLERARIQAIATEAKGITNAIQQLKNQYNTGIPPTDLREPDNSASRIYKFVQQTFPRYDVTKLTIDLDDEEINYADFDPGYSLVFWLVGFSGDPGDPFRGHKRRMGLGGAEPELENAFYAFEKDRIRFGRYFPQMPGDIESLYTFDDTDSDDVWDDDETFDGRNAFLYFDAFGAFRGLTDTNVMTYLGFKPYRKTDGGAHYNNEGVQIVSAGLDKQLGQGTGPASGWLILDCDDASNAGKRCDEDADNVTNFTEGTIEDHEDK